MKLTIGKTYKAPGTVLHAKVLAIYHISEEYTKAKLQLTINGVVQEKPKTWKLFHKRISHWEEI